MVDVVGLWVVRWMIDVVGLCEPMVVGLGGLGGGVCWWGRVCDGCVGCGLRDVGDVFGAWDWLSRFCGWNVLLFSGADGGDERDVVCVDSWGDVWDGRQA